MKDKDGSILQLWTLASFLMLSSISALTMIFVDRLMLARYNLEAHNTAIEVANLGWAFQTGWTSLANICQVFVSQYYGAGQKHMLSRPVWQMIWFSLFSFVLFMPLAIWCPSLILDEKIKQSYLFWIVICIPFQAIFSALCGFFIGQKQTRLTLIAILFGNILNLALAASLIFGIPGLLSPLGAIGAILATDIAIVSQAAFLFAIFWRQSKQFQIQGQKHFAFDFNLCRKCLQVGFPSAMYSIFEALGWSLFYTMMASLSHVHLTVAGIVQNVLILSFFFADGLWKAVSALSGNAIGRVRSELVPKIVHSAFFLMTAFAFCLGAFLWSMRSIISDWFLSGLPEEEQTLIYPALLFGLANAVLYKYLEGIRLSIGGALMAAADTKFLMVFGAASVWIFMVLPIYFLVYRGQGSIEFALMICSFYTLATALVFMWRFYSGRWMRKASLVQREVKTV